MAVEQSGGDYPEILEKRAVVGIAAPGSLRPPSIGTLPASPRLPGKTCLSLSFSGAGGSSSGGPYRQGILCASRVVTSHWALGAAGQGKAPWGHGSWDEAAGEPQGQVEHEATAAEGP